MKPILTFVVAIIWFDLSYNCLAQTDHRVVVPNLASTTYNNLQYQCDKSIQDLNGQTITLMGNVTIRTDKFECQNANKVVYNRKMQKITVFGCKKFSIKGEIITVLKKTKEKRIEYSLGNDKAYILY